MTRKKTPEMPIKVFDLNAFARPFRSESDRACAVLGGAMLDAQLEKLFERRLRASKAKLLDYPGPLSTFSARITVARALAWITEDVRFDLDKVKSIRNDFAHEPDHELSFSAQSIAVKCRALRVAQVLLDAHEHAASEGHKHLSPQVIRAMGAIFEPPRQRFEITVEMLAQHIDELPGDSSEYQGPDLRATLWALGSRVDFKVTMTGTVG